MSSQSSDVLDLLVPILHYLNDARADQARVGLMHIGEHLMMPTTKMMMMMSMTLMIIFRSFHTSSSEWGEELWSEIEQGIM